MYVSWRLFVELPQAPTTDMEKWDKVPDKYWNAGWYGHQVLHVYIYKHIQEV